ncbi:amylo-alpha-1,6-glucosidase [Terracoccus luteus]|uniref:Glycogen debranching enzyme n=1 Tax=Terracoccus luteus TaxID=53356 RepID=A0A839PWU4_9MICO|nr:glycogen debranching N-terminal domain-containing protein [Terracoccus luteus]MBB2987987.1 glycogen debranching enzyme [Terracoccus luteus]MCP2173638.1 glycogen debranching enzyme [Terracoccus luteus]
MRDRQAGRPPRQPWLHELSIVVNGNATALSDRSGDMESGTAHGWFVDDRRVLSRLVLEVDGERPSPVAGRASGATGAYSTSARSLGDAGADPTVQVVRERRLAPGSLHETVTVASSAACTVRCVLRLRFAGDGADIASVKSGHLDAPPLPARLDGDGVSWSDEWHRTTVTVDAAATSYDNDADGALVDVPVVVEPGAATSVTLVVRVERVQPSAFDADPGADAVDWSRVRVVADDPRLGPTLQQSLADLQHLLLHDPAAPEDVFLAAGTPWYLTLFGRDSLWAARLTLPLGTDVALGTLRTLARRQGRTHDPVTGEAPGKIPHELRRHVYLDTTTGMALPQVYYGTVDATALWVSVLAEAVDWGLDPAHVHELTPALRAAVGWLTGDGQPDEDGLLKYLDTTGAGLANQGWKDSGDSIRWRDGHVADAPIALVEAQAYAVAALDGAARLYGLLGIDGADTLVTQADRLRGRLRDRFWVDTDAGHHLAIALDGAGHAVDGLASNMGHVLGTGSLRADEAALVAATVTGDELLDEFGVRTFGTGNGGFNPIGYHTGSIWTHDTAIVAVNLARDGFVDHAVRVARSLLASSDAFGRRWPELYSGVAFAGAPTPYPASCRPQAWSAASAIALLTVALGLRPDATTRTLHLRPARAFGALRVEGLQFAGGRVDLQVGPGGEVTVLRAPDGVRVEVDVTPGS